MIVVTKKKGDTKDTLFRKFLRLFLEEKVADDVRSKLFYKPKSLLRQEEKKARKMRRSRHATI